MTKKDSAASYKMSFSQPFCHPRPASAGRGSSNQYNKNAIPAIFRYKRIAMRLYNLLQNFYIIL